ncbi:MAG: hypothetical protein WCA44_14850 [Acidobacteriaceae bacterium]|jgi:hypothetical protein
MAHHAMFRVIAGWALLNVSAILFFVALFVVEQKRRRRRRDGGPVIRMAGNRQGR